MGTSAGHTYRAHCNSVCSRNATLSQLDYDNPAEAIVLHDIRGEGGAVESRVSYSPTRLLRNN